MLVTDSDTDKILLVRNKYFDYSKTYDQFLNLKTKDEIKIIDSYHLDPWIRDYSYLQFNNEFIRFKFYPTYLQKYMCESIQEEFDKIISHSIHINIRLDMGNFIHNGKYGICTNKVLRLNKHFSESKIKNILINLLKLEDIYFIPTIPGEKTGHVDAMAQFITPSLLAIDDEAEEYCSSLKSIPGVDHIILSSYKSHEQIIPGWKSIKGLYVNFLHTKNAYYISEFKQKEDEDMYNLFSQFNKPVYAIECSDISSHGGGLHCITWNYK